VIAPLINSAADAAALVREARYPPLGTRSFGPIRAGLLAPDYFKIANAHVLCWAMIETAAALEQVEAIAAVDGLDGLFIGPNDLSLALGVEPSSAPTDPKVVAGTDAARPPPAGDATARRGAAGRGRVLTDLRACARAAVCPHALSARALLARLPRCAAAGSHPEDPRRGARLF
jgi:hypothetical protein